MLIRLVIHLAAPVLTYMLLRPHLGSDLIALAVGAAIPTTYTAALLLVRRRLDPIGVFAITSFAIGLLVAIATGGNALVFKLREDPWTGPLGLAFLVSAVARRPLFFTILQLVARRNPQLAQRIHDPDARRIGTVTTWVIAALVLVHALAMVALAMATTPTFLALSRPISLAIGGGGMATLVAWIYHQRAGRKLLLDSLSASRSGVNVGRSQDVVVDKPVENQRPDPPPTALGSRRWLGRRPS